MEVFGFLALIAMVVCGGYGVLKARNPKIRIACLGYFIMGVCISFIAIDSMSSSPEYDHCDGYNVSFKGTHCSGTLGCSCPGFNPITNGDIWQEDYCRHCNHKKSNHR